jgi:subtilase family serine protease
MYWEDRDMAIRPDAIVKTLLLVGLGLAQLQMSLAQIASDAPVGMSAGPERGGVTLKGHVPAWATADSDIGRVDSTEEVRHLTLYLSRSSEEERAFQHLLLAQQTPGDPSFHLWYTPSELGRQFGASDERIQSVTNWLRQRGLRVLNVSNSKTFIEFSGSVAALSSAFEVSFHWFRGNGSNRWSITSEPTIPSALASAILSISGLSMELEHSSMKQGPSGTAYSSCTSATCTNYITPSDFAKIYDLPLVSNSGLNGSGRVIDVIAEALIDPADVPAFNAITQSAVPIPTVIVPPANATILPAPITVPQDPPCTESSNSAVCEQLSLQQEATLDVERAGSVASGASLQLIVSTGDGMGDRGTLVDTEYVVDAANTPDIVTISFYYCESANVAALVDDWNALFEQAAAEGISVFVSSGDSDATCSEEKFASPTQAGQFLSVNYLCSSSSVTCVGGTEFVEGSNPSMYWGSNGKGLQSALQWIPEGAWNDPAQTDSQGNTIYDVEGSGGGISQLLPAPPWQSSLPDVAPLLGRALPDVAFSSSCHDAYFACMESNGKGDNCIPDLSGDFRFANFCGTSAATPSMAGIMALVDQASSGRQGNANPELYNLAMSPGNMVFHDTTIASSGVMNCTLDTASLCNNTPPSMAGLTGGAPGYLLQDGFDEVTGLGSIDVQNLLVNWKAAPSLWASPASITINAPGGENSTILSFAGFSATDLSLSCANLPVSSECQFGEIAPNNTVKLTIATNTAHLGGGKSMDPGLAISIRFVIAWFLPRPLWGFQMRRRMDLLQLSLFVTALFTLMNLSGCSSHGTTPTGTTTIVVTATEGSISASTQIEVVVE